jgi:hypothetical protein
MTRPTFRGKMHLELIFRGRKIRKIKSTTSSFTCKAVGMKALIHGVNRGRGSLGQGQKFDSRKSKQKKIITSPHLSQTFPA